MWTCLLSTHALKVHPGLLWGARVHGLAHGVAPAGPACTSAKISHSSHSTQPVGNKGHGRTGAHVLEGMHSTAAALARLLPREAATARVPSVAHPLPSLVSCVSCVVCVSE